MKAPLFPGYLFVNDVLDKATHTEIRKSRGLVRILGDGGTGRPRCREAEIEAIRRLVDSRAACCPIRTCARDDGCESCPGRLADLEGILTRVRPDKGLLVVSVNLLQRSVAVEVDCTQVAPAA